MRAPCETYLSMARACFLQFWLAWATDSMARRGSQAHIEEGHQLAWQQDGIPFACGTRASVNAASLDRPTSHRGPPPLWQTRLGCPSSAHRPAWLARATGLRAD